MVLRPGQPENPSCVGGFGIAADRSGEVAVNRDDLIDRRRLVKQPVDMAVIERSGCDDDRGRQPKSVQPAKRVLRVKVEPHRCTDQDVGRAAPAAHSGRDADTGVDPVRDAHGVVHELGELIGRANATKCRNAADPRSWWATCAGSISRRYR
jgi:hypothetical protein